MTPPIWLDADRDGASSTRPGRLGSARIGLGGGADTSRHPSRPECWISEARRTLGGTRQVAADLILNDDRVLGEQGAPAVGAVRAHP